MKKILLALTCLIAVTAQADSRASLTGLHMNEQLADYITRNMINKNTSNNVEIPVASGKTFIVNVAKTPVANIGSTGLTFTGASANVRNNTLPAVMTPITALTPNAGDVLVGRVSIMATASPTLAYVELPAATANAGAAFGVYNKGASPLLIVPNGVVAATDAINASAAATPYSCATAKFCDCRVIGAGTYMCVSQ